ncbi:hypothetical protein [Streptomyces sp. NPDC059224]|uniref:hypothetical protein n=1 Tax=Streptomyces sp. NPDC059224 TaxID=3346775 RepID=UPI0036B4B5EA
MIRKAVGRPEAGAGGAVGQPPETTSKLSRSLSTTTSARTTAEPARRLHPRAAPDAEVPMAQAGFRDTVPVAVSDPYAHEGTTTSTPPWGTARPVPELRPARAGPPLWLSNLSLRAVAVQCGALRAVPPESGPPSPASHGALSALEALAPPGFGDSGREATGRHTAFTDPRLGPTGIRTFVDLPAAPPSTPL